MHTTIIFISANIIIRSRWFIKLIKHRSWILQRNDVTSLRAVACIKKERWQFNRRSVLLFIYLYLCCSKYTRVAEYLLEGINTVLWNLVQYYIGALFVYYYVYIK